MISCTEFIPLYSEFFKYLEAKGGHDEVVKYWIHISDTSIGDKTNPNSLAYKCEKFGGFKGAIAYWGHTLTEEACDLLEIESDEKKFRYSHMRHCPSKENMNVHINRVRKSMPPSGLTSILSITDKQYGEIQNFWGKVERAKLTTPQQLEFF